MPSISTLNMQLRWLRLQRKFLKYLPVQNHRKKTLITKNKLEGTKIISLMQEQLIHNLFGKGVSGIVYDSYNGTMVSSIKDVQVNKELGRGGFNQKEIEILKSIIPAESCLYIIGTHIGTLLVPIGKDVRKVIGFEANPSTYKLLVNNVNINSLHNAQVFNYAICDKKSSLTFYQNSANSGGSKIKPQKDNFIYNYDNPEAIEIEGDSLDNLQRKYTLEMPDCMIMDIEGAEYLALKGASGCLSGVRMLYIEFVPHHLENVAGIQLDDFIKVLPHFKSMKIMHDLLNGSDKEYKGDELKEVMKNLYAKGKSADLLFFK